MTKILMAAAVAVMGATAVQAADLPARDSTKAPASVPFTWTGSYLGLYAGGATGAADVTTTDPRTAAGVAFTGAGPVSYGLGSSVIGGYSDGYNWQFAPNWVLGYESETGYISLKGSKPFSAVGFNAAATTRTEHMYSVWSARFGYAAGRSLFYAKGGIALARFETGVTNTLGSVLDTTRHKFAVGYAAGAGYEYAIDNKWSVKAEYLYLGFDKDISSSGNAVPPAVLETASTRLAGIHTGKIGLNYKWDWLSLLR